MKVYTVVLVRVAMSPSSLDVDLEVETYLFENSDTAALFVDEQDKLHYWSRIEYNEEYVK